MIFRVWGYRGQAFEAHFMWIRNPIYYWTSMVVLQSSNGISNTRHDMDGRQNKNVKNKKISQKENNGLKRKSNKSMAEIQNQIYTYLFCKVSILTHQLFTQCWLFCRSSVFVGQSNCSTSKHSCFELVWSLTVGLHSTRSIFPGIGQSWSGCFFPILSLSLPNWPHESEKIWGKTRFLCKV